MFSLTVQMEIIDYRKVRGHVIDFSLESFHIESLVPYTF